MDKNCRAKSAADYQKAASDSESSVNEDNLSVESDRHLIAHLRHRADTQDGNKTILGKRVSKHKSNQLVHASESDLQKEQLQDMRKDIEVNGLDEDYRKDVYSKIEGKGAKQGFKKREVKKSNKRKAQVSDGEVD